MKKTKIIYWILTGLLAGVMLMSAITSIMCAPSAVDLQELRNGLMPDLLLI